MIGDIASFRITEGELARDVHSVLEKVERGNEVIIEREDHRPLAVTKRPQPVGRKIGDCIALAKAYEEKLGYAPLPRRGVRERCAAGHRRPSRTHSQHSGELARGITAAFECSRCSRASGCGRQHAA